MPTAKLCACALYKAEFGAPVPLPVWAAVGLEAAFLLGFEGSITSITRWTNLIKQGTIALMFWIPARTVRGSFLKLCTYYSTSHSASSLLLTD